MDINTIIGTLQFNTENEKIDFERWIARIDQMIGTKDINEVLRNKEQLCKFFYLQKGSGVSRASYQKIRKHLDALLGYYGIDPSHMPTREEVLSSAEAICFYEGLDSLITFIDEVGKNKLEEFSSKEVYDSKKDLLITKSIAVLGWYGFELSEVATTQKTSVHSENGRYFVAKVEIELRFYEILKNLSASSEYKGLPSGKMQTFKSDDKYLFRSTAENGSVAGNNLADNLKRFNAMSGSTGYAVVFRHLKKNALFTNIYSDEREIKTSQKIIDHFQLKAKDNKPQSTIKTAYGLEKEYNRWKDLYHKK